MIDNQVMLYVLLIIVGFIIKGLTMVIPILVLYLGAAALLSPGLAILVATVGLMLELTVGYQVGKRLGKKRILKRLDHYPKVLKVQAYAAEKSFRSAVLSRVVPGPPIDLISMCLGAFGASYGSYMLGSLLVLVPRMVMIILAGEVVVRRDLSAYGIALLILMGILYLIRRIRKKRTQLASVEETIA